MAGERPSRSSRQQAIFGSGGQRTTYDKTDFKVTTIECARVDRLQSLYPDMTFTKRRNVFARTRISLDEAAASEANATGSSHVGGAAFGGSLATGAALAKSVRAAASVGSGQHGASTAAAAGAASAGAAAGGVSCGGGSSSKGAADEAVRSGRVAYRHYVGDDEVVMLDIVRTGGKASASSSPASSSSGSSSSASSSSAAASFAGAARSKSKSTSSVNSGGNGGGSMPSGSQKAKGFVRGGPRETIVWGAGEVRAAIVSCGGLCPGVNDVIEELFNCLYYNYGVDVVYGIKVGGWATAVRMPLPLSPLLPRLTQLVISPPLPPPSPQNGFAGFWAVDHQPWQQLTPMSVRGISGRGGSVLGHGATGFDTHKILNACEVYGINQLYLIGGDGTHARTEELCAAVAARKMKLAVGVIPKSIDNDLGIIDTYVMWDVSCV